MNAFENKCYNVSAYGGISKAKRCVGYVSSALTASSYEPSNMLIAHDPNLVFTSLSYIMLALSTMMIRKKDFLSKYPSEKKWKRLYFKV